MPKHFYLPEIKCLSGLIFLCICLLCSCGGNKANPFPSEFKEFTEDEKIQWLTENLPADSVARIICNNSSGLDSVIYINDFSVFVSNLYSKYDAENKDKFGEELNRYAASMPSQYKMKLYMLASQDNPRQLGYRYAEDCDANKTEPAAIEADLAALKTICGSNPGFYTGFINGVNAYKTTQKIR